MMWYSISGRWAFGWRGRHWASQSLLDPPLTRGDWLSWVFHNPALRWELRFLWWEKAFNLLGQDLQVETEQGSLYNLAYFLLATAQTSNWQWACLWWCIHSFCRNKMPTVTIFPHSMPTITRGTSDLFNCNTCTQSMPSLHPHTVTS